MTLKVSMPTDRKPNLVRAGSLSVSDLCRDPEESSGVVYMVSRTDDNIVYAIAFAPRRNPYATTMSADEMVEPMHGALSLGSEPVQAAPAAGFVVGLTADEAHDLREGRKIQAIKSVRTRTSVGLKEAKDLVEACGPFTAGRW